jgi:dipeptidyl aminopeptidase/acylaminoacyl peptidase
MERVPAGEATATTEPFGEEEIYVVPQDGSAPPTKLTSGGMARRFNLRWSPDASRLAFYDKDGKLFVLTVADRKLVEVAHDPRAVITDYRWSPRGNHLAFAMSEPGYNARSIHIWSAADAKVRPVTTGAFDEYSPAWDSALRNWATLSKQAAAVVRRVDEHRINIIREIFLHLGYLDPQALVRARIVYFHQVGYYTLALGESLEQRETLLPVYVDALLGTPER